MVKSDLETVIQQFIPRYTIKVSRGQRYAAPIDDQPQDLGPLVDALKADRRFGRLGLDKGVLDETPGAYKPIDKVMAAQRGLVEVVAVLRQVVCVKG